MCVCVSSVCVCKCVRTRRAFFLQTPLHIFPCLHPEIHPCEPATVCVFASTAPFAFMDVCVCVYLCTSAAPFPPLPAPAPCHSEEPGGDSRGRGGKALTAATCHISQLEFGGNQFGTLIRSMTPTPAAAEQGPGQRLSPTAPAKKMGELNPGGHKSSILNHLLQTNGGANLAGPAKLNYYWLDKKLQRIFFFFEGKGRRRAECVLMTGSRKGEVVVAA